MTDESEGDHVPIEQRAEELRPTSIEEIDTDEQCQTWYGPQDNGANRCGAEASYEVTLKNDYEQDDPVVMKVCPGCKRAYQDRNEVFCDVE